MFLTEVDYSLVDESYEILDYDTVIHKKYKDSDENRITALMKVSVNKRAKIRIDIMVENYLNIWIQFIDENNKQYLIGAFYRGWGQN